MTKIKYLFFLIYSIIYSISLSAQLSIGMRENKYINVAYTLNNNYQFKIEHSIYASKFKEQYLRIYIGYKKSLNKKWKISAIPYFGTTYNSSYFNCGCIINANYNILKWLYLQTNINPHYDSFFRFKICYANNINIYLNKHIDFFCEYTTIPEYRESEKRCRTGLIFHMNIPGTRTELSVLPMLSVPIENRIRTLRLQTNMNFTF